MTVEWYVSVVDTLPTSGAILGHLTRCSHLAYCSLAEQYELHTAAWLGRTGACRVGHLRCAFVDGRVQRPKASSKAYFRHRA